MRGIVVEPSSEEIERARKELYDAVNKTRRKIGLEPIPFHSNPEPVYCSFCGEEPEEVSSMIWGVDVYICDECVHKCHDIVTAGSN